MSAEPVNTSPRMQRVVMDAEKVSNLFDKLEKDALRLQSTKLKPENRDKLAQKVAGEVSTLKGLFSSARNLVRHPTIRSTVENPVALVKEYVSTHPFDPREDTLRELVAMGVNPSTARTQYQRARRALK